MSGQRIGYTRVSTIEQNTARQLDGVQLDQVFTDHASGKDTKRPQLEAMLKHVRKGDTVLCHSMDRMARNLDDLRKLVSGLTSKGVRVEFQKEGLMFTGEANPMAEMMLNIIGAVAQFERSMILERQREGIAIAKAAGAYKGGKAKLTPKQVLELKVRARTGEAKTSLAREYGVTRETVYQYLKSAD